MRRERVVRASRGERERKRDEVGESGEGMQRRERERDQ